MVENPLKAHQKNYGGPLKNTNANSKPRINMIKIKADHGATAELRQNVAKQNDRVVENTSWMSGADQENIKQLRILQRPPVVNNKVDPSQLIASYFAGSTDITSGRGNIEVEDVDSDSESQTDFMGPERRRQMAASIFS